MFLNLKRTGTTEYEIVKKIAGNSFNSKEREIENYSNIAIEEGVSEAPSTKNLSDTDIDQVSY